VKATWKEITFAVFALWLLRLIRRPRPTLTEDEADHYERAAKIDRWRAEGFRPTAGDA
jgi:hypothetical protein